MPAAVSDGASFDYEPKHVVTIGSRVRKRNATGTVLYLGPVKNYEGEWVGVDWDDPKRGKHDGSIGGVRYFTASYPTSGSFTRPDQVDAGRSLFSVMDEQYNVCAQQGSRMKVATKSLCIVGMNKLAEKVRSEKLTCCCLNSSEVSHVGNLERFADYPSLAQLFLADTLISDWSDVAVICANLPNLQLIDVSKNRFKPVQPSLIGGLKAKKLSHVSTLFLNDVTAPLEETWRILSMFPNLKELRLCRNKLCELQPLNLPLLEMLDLECNYISDWNHVAVLATLPRLETLNLSQNKISAVRIKSLSQCSNPFPLLRALYLSRNKIADWDSVNELRLLPSLRFLTISENPFLYSFDKRTATELVIARIRRLETLDKMTIEPNERKGAEIDYLKMFASEWVRLSAAADVHSVTYRQFCDSHPRYAELVAEYGLPETFDSPETCQLLKNNLLDINISFNGVEKRVSRKVPATMTVRKLKLLVGRLFQVNPLSLNLTYQSSRVADITFPLDDDTKSLSFYSVESADSVLVGVTC